MGMCGYEFLKINFQKNQYNQLQEYISEVKNISVRATENNSNVDEVELALSPVEINPDYLSVVSVGNINELVVSGDEYYLNHDFYKQVSIYGTPFVFPDNKLDDPVLVIYGHSSTDGLVFSDAKKWLDPVYFYKNEHGILTFLDADYEVVIAGKSNFTEAVPYYSVPKKEGFIEWLQAQKNQGFNVKNFDVNAISQAVVLSTCDMVDLGNRVYLIAVK